MELNQRIKYFRKKSKLSQDAVAKKCCVSRTTVCNWESGRRSPDHSVLLKLANLFNVNVEELIYGISREFVTAEQTIQSTNIIKGNDKIVFVVPILNAALLFLTLISMLVVFLPICIEKYNINKDNFLAYENVENVKIRITDANSSFKEYYMKNSAIRKMYYLNDIEIDFYEDQKGFVYNKQYLSICVELKSNVSYNLIQKRQFKINDHNLLSFDNSFSYLYFKNEGLYSISIHFDNNIGFIEVTLSE